MPSKLVTQKGDVMNKTLKVLLFSGLVSASAAQAADVGFNVNLNVGNRPAPVPVYASPGVVIEEPPVFIQPPALGFYVAVGIPYDIMFVSNYYYLHKGDAWYRAPHYNGPWVVAPYKSLPPGIRKHRFDRIRYYRDQEYGRFRSDQGHYGGRQFRPEKQWKERQKQERREMKEERKHEKEAWKNERKRDKEEWKHGGPGGPDRGHGGPGGPGHGHGGPHG
jgi:hypothetical protein